MSLHLVEANRASSELREIGIENQILIINGLLQSHRSEDEVSTAFYERQRRALKETPDALKQVVTFSLPFVSYSLTGVDNLRHLFSSYTITVFEDDSHSTNPDSTSRPKQSN